METGFNRPKHIEFSAHPACTVVVSLIYAAVCLGYIIFNNWFISEVITPLKIDINSLPPWIMAWFSRPYLSFVLGLCIGVPVMLVQKRLMSRRLDFLAEFHTTAVIKRFRWPVLRVIFMILLPLFLAVPDTFCLTYLLLRITPLPAIFGVFILYPMVYPEQAIVYRLAKERLSKLNEESR